jgi:hypothetical protein
VSHKTGFCNSALKFLDKVAKKKQLNALPKIDWTAASKAARKYVRPLINGKMVNFKLDSGSDWTIIAIEDWFTLTG